MDREITGHISTLASNLSRTGLANEDFAITDFLTTEALDTETLASIVVNIFGGTASFDM